jgi:hypothetical protein
MFDQCNLDQSDRKYDSTEGCQEHINDVTHLSTVDLKASGQEQLTCSCEVLEDAAHRTSRVEFLVRMLKATREHYLSSSQLLIVFPWWTSLGILKVLVKHALSTCWETQLGSLS